MKVLHTVWHAKFDLKNYSFLLSKNVNINQRKKKVCVREHKIYEEQKSMRYNEFDIWLEDM